VSLAKFIAQENAIAQFFSASKNPWTVYPTETSALTDAHKAELAARLSSAMSPESLTCDGELRGAKLAAKRKLLEKAIADLAALGEIVVLLD
jgi:endo-alpha-1,4-polygalactosaminidase (GH114 family)